MSYCWLDFLEGQQGFIDVKILLGCSRLMAGTTVVQHNLCGGLRQLGLRFEAVLHHPGQLEAPFCTERCDLVNERLPLFFWEFL